MTSSSCANDDIIKLCEWLCEQGGAALAAVPVQERKTSVLMENLADILWRQGKAEQAEPLFKEIVSGRQEVLGLVAIMNARMRACHTLLTDLRCHTLLTDLACSALPRS